MARPEKAFGGAFEICLKKVCGNIHLQLEALGLATKMDFCYPHDSSSFFGLGYWWMSQPNSAHYGFRRELLRRMTT
jgi:hypothetical protein